MSLFSSARERRLWFWAVAVVIGIYSTLGLARTLAKVLRDRGLISDVIWLGLFLLGAAIVAQGLKMRLRGAEIGVALGVAGVYLIVLMRLALPEERSHLIEYTVVALLIYEALMERVSQGRRVPLPALTAVVATGTVGVLDECIQALLPSRVFDYRAWFILRKIIFTNYFLIQLSFRRVFEEESRRNNAVGISRRTSK